MMKRIGSKRVLIWTDLSEEKHVLIFWKHWEKGVAAYFRDTEGTFVIQRTEFSWRDEIVKCEKVQL